MESSSLLFRLIQANLLTLYYSFLTLLVIGVNYVKNLFVASSAPKRRLEPPANLSDPKYGVHKYIKVNNIKLHYVESGDPSKPLMLFVHGFPEFWYSWRHQITDFNKDYWCVAVDMRGYCDSERPEGIEPYKIEYLIEDIRDLVRQLGREKCILVSHDWGGLIACRYRDLYPETLSALVLLASMSREAWLKELLSNPVQRKKSWYVFMYRSPMIPEWMLTMNNLNIFDKLMLRKGKDTVTPEDTECYKYWFGKQYAFTPPVNYYRANFDMGFETNKEVKGGVPMLVALAEKDLFINTSVLGQMEKEYRDIETTIIEKCGHFLQQEEPVKVNKCIRDFLVKNNVS